MSKRTTFIREIKRMTKSRSFAKAIHGWTILNDVALSAKSPQAVCEFCNTRFRKGAVIQKTLDKARTHVKVTVGGTCLETVLRGSFGDSKEIAARKKETTLAIKREYGELVADVGAWTDWLVKNVPHRLTPLVAHLKHVGLRTFSDLRKLIAFHDKNRLFPREALLPHWRDGLKSTKLDQLITIDQARRILNDEDNLRRMIQAASDSYWRDEIRPFAETLKHDSRWWKAWQLDPRGKRMAIALFALTERMQEEDINVSAITESLSLLDEATYLPVLGWNPSLGAGIIEELSEDAEDAINVWLWQTDEYVASRLDEWRSAVPKSEDAVFAAEMDVFWKRPRWFRGRVPNFRRRRKGQQSIPKKVESDDSPDWQKQLRDLLDFDIVENAQLELGSSARVKECVEWFKERVEKQGQSWPDFEWMLKHYSAGGDARDNVDRIIQAICREMSSGLIGCGRP